jgi:hypothetical protein
MCLPQNMTAMEERTTIRFISNKDNNNLAYLEPPSYAFNR